MKRVLTRIIHKYCCALACSFVRNKPLISCPYALLRTPFSKSVANKGPARQKNRCRSNSPPGQFGAANRGF
jgi:hypothetical protein